MRNRRALYRLRWLHRLALAFALTIANLLLPLGLLPVAAANNATIALVTPSSVQQGDPGPLVISTPTPQDAFALKDWGNGNQYYRVAVKVTATSSITGTQIQFAVQATCAQVDPLDFSYWNGNAWTSVTPSCNNNLFTYLFPSTGFNLGANQSQTFELKIGFAKAATLPTTISLVNASGNTLTFTWNGGISAAVANAQANSTIRVAPGTYQEQVTVNKNLTIQGSGQSGSGATVLTPPSSLSTTSCNGPVTAAVGVVGPASTATLQNLAIDYSSQSGAVGVLFCGVNGNASNLTIKADTGVLADNSGSNTAHTVALNGLTVTLGNNVGAAMKGVGNNGNLTFNVSNSTVNGGNNANQSGIALTSATGTLQGNTIKNVSQGSAIAIADTSGPVSVTNNTLSGNATGISLTGVTNVTVNGNTITSPASGTGIAATDSTATIQGNTIQNGAIGIAVATANNGSPNVTANSNVITGTTSAALSRDATNNATGTIFNAHGNRIVINNGFNAKSVGGTSATFDARYNWWGQNVPPANSFSGNVLYQPTLQLVLSVNPLTLPPNGQAQVTATIAGGGYNVPDGTPVSFGTNLAIATIAPVNATFSNGQATATLTALQSGVVSVSATVDNQTISVPVTITPAAAPTLTLVPATQNVTVGNQAQLTATLVNPSGPVSNITITVTVTGANPRTFSVVTNANGQATITYSGSNTGTDTVTATAQVAGNPTATATVNWTAAAPPPPPPSPGFGPAQPAAPNPSPACIYFPQTRHNLCFGFRAYWQQFGGLAIFGYPITEEFQENGLTVQYFERARFEWHPGQFPQRYDVLLGLLGDEVTAGRTDPAFQPAQPNSSPACIYFPQTRHNLCSGFRAYWEQFGGLATFGYPISEEFQEVNPDTGKVYTVQYFERERFEWHPGEFPQRYDVLLGRLGAQVLHNRYGTPYP